MGFVSDTLNRASRVVERAASTATRIQRRTRIKNPFVQADDNSGGRIGREGARLNESGREEAGPYVDQYAPGDSQEEIAARNAQQELERQRVAEQRKLRGQIASRVRRSGTTGPNTKAGTILTGGLGTTGSGLGQFAALLGL